VTYKAKQTAVDDSGLPAALRDALAAAEVTLKSRDTVYNILAASHTTISELLSERQRLQAELSHLEVTGTDTAALGSRLRECEMRLEEQQRKRRGAVSALLADDRVGATALIRVKQQITEAQREFVEANVSEFRHALDQEIARLQQLWAYGDRLAAALNVTIDMPVPGKVSSHVRHAGEVERLSGPPVEATLPQAIERLSAILAASTTACRCVTRLLALRVSTRGATVWRRTADRRRR